MVTLLELQQRAADYSHLDSGLASLGIQFSNAIYDLQTTPSNTALYPVVANLLVSHLKADKSHHVLFVHALRPFPWLWIHQHPAFDPEWLESRISVFATNTFAELYALFCGTKLNSFPQKCLLVIANFHEAAQLYKLQLSAAYQEALLKSHIARNSAALAGQKTLPELPPSSNLLRESPALKFQAHISSLTSLIAQHAYSTNLVCLLTGFLIPKSLPFSQETPDASFTFSQPPKSSQSVNSASESQQSQSTRRTRPVLVPSLDDSGNSAHLKSAFSDYVAARLVFYKDWYHKTPHYKHHVARPISADSPYLRLVHAVEIMAPTSALLVLKYMDFDQQYYHDIDSTQLIKRPQHAFLDLSKIEPKNANIPSSPDISASQLRNLVPDFSSEIEASDDELSVLHPLAALHMYTSEHHDPDEPR